MRLKKRDIFPGQVLDVRAGRELILDACYQLSGRARILPDGACLVVVTKPRRTMDGIRDAQGLPARPYLVRVRVNAVEEFECYYCDIVNNCQLSCPA